MKSLCPLFCFIFLFSCSSVEKNPYVSIKEESDFLETNKDPSREIAYLKNISKFEEGNFQFVTKQIKEVVKKYSRMKQQLVQIENKLDRLLAQQILRKDSQKKFQSRKEQGDTLFTEEDEQEETLVSEDSSLLQEEITDDMDMFQDEEIESNPIKRNKSPQNQKEPLSKTVENEAEKSIIIPDENKGPIKVSLKTIDDYISLMQDILSNKFRISNKTKQALLKKLRRKFKSFKGSNEQPASLIEAKTLFEQESYESAISEFQKYRDNNPKGKHYPEATFYIGQSFKNLQMPSEAEIFFKEIVKSYPKSLWASRAKKSLEE